MTARSLAFFDRIYVVNLAKRLDRRREMAAQLRGIGLALDRPPLQLFPAIRPDTAGPFPTIGTRGCFMSHLGVLLDAEKARYRRIAILEDDVDFSPTFDADFPPVADRLESEPWDIFYGGHRIESGVSDAAADRVVRAVAPETPIVTAHFIAFSGDTVAAVARYLERMLARSPGDPAGGPMHVDGAYSWYRASHPACRTLVSGRQLAVQRASRTDIHTLKWFDRVPLIRDVAQTARRWRQAP